MKKKEKDRRVSKYCFDHNDAFLLIIKQEKN